MYSPRKEVIERAILKDWDELAAFAERDLEGFWAREAEELVWFKKWEKVLDDSQAPLLQVVRGRQGEYRL